MPGRARSANFGVEVAFPLSCSILRAEAFYVYGQIHFKVRPARGLHRSLPFRLERVCGKVTGEDGKPVEGAIIRIERKDIKWNATLKTNKRGEYTHAGVPVGGTYKIVCAVGGQDVDARDNVKPRLGEQNNVSFDLAEVKKVRSEQGFEAALRAAAAKAS